MTVASVDEVLALYERWGSEHYDEELSQQAHALQTAALARSAGASDALVVAALLHDVGHLLDLEEGRANDVDLRHEATGAAYLAPLFGPAVTGSIALHVRAKRYLCATDPAYTAGLSAGSVHSLALQGGPMSLAEIEAFEALPRYADAVRLRRWDDGGKELGAAVAPLATYVGLLCDLSR